MLFEISIILKNTGLSYDARLKVIGLYSLNSRRDIILVCFIFDLLDENIVVVDLLIVWFRTLTNNFHFFPYGNFLQHFLKRMVFY